MVELMYLSSTSNTIVSFLFAASLVAETFVIVGFIKSTNPIEKSCCLLEFPFESVKVPAAILITVLPLHSKYDFPDCFELCCHVVKVNVYCTPFVIEVAELNVFVTLVAVSPSTNTVILSLVNEFPL